MRRPRHSQSRGNRIPRDAGLGADEQALLAEHPVDERGLAGIGAADDGDLQRAIRRVVVVSLLLVVELGQSLGKCVMQLADTLAMFGRERDWVAEAERERLVSAGQAGAALGLVGDEHHRAAGAAHQFGEGLVGGEDAGAGIDDEQHDVGFEDRGFGLRAHAAEQRIGIGLFEPRRVDDAKHQSAEVDVALAPVAGHAGAIVHEGELLAHQTVEEGRLADIRPSDDSDGRHVHGGLDSVVVRRKFVVQASCRNSAQRVTGGGAAGSEAGAAVTVTGPPATRAA